MREQITAENLDQDKMVNKWAHADVVALNYLGVLQEQMIVLESTGEILSRVGHDQYGYFYMRNQKKISINENEKFLIN
jgi:hypothetical protein